METEIDFLALLRLLLPLMEGEGLDDHAIAEELDVGVSTVPVLRRQVSGEARLATRTREGIERAARARGLIGGGA